MRNFQAALSAGRRELLGSATVTFDVVGTFAELGVATADSFQVSHWACNYWALVEIQSALV